MKRLLVIFYLFFIFPIFPKIIITHGVFGLESSWYKQGGDFYEAVNKVATQTNKEVISFSWKQPLGGVSHKERFDAGKELAKLVIDLTSKGEKEIIAIGHSYGGHVIKAASQILAVALDYQVITAPVLVANRIPQDLTLDEKEFFKKACEEIREYKDKKNFSKDLKKEYLLDAVYTLGTPLDLSDYYANMNVIQFLFNIYSEGDIAQDLVGGVILPLPRHERAVNLNITVEAGGWFGTEKPTHLGMHAEEIGKWILLIPFYLMEEMIGNFNKFSFKYDGKINFKRNRNPFYTTNYQNATDTGAFSKYDLNWLKNKIKFLRELC